MARKCEICGKFIGPGGYVEYLTDEEGNAHAIKTGYCKKHHNMLKEDLLSDEEVYYEW